MNVFPTENIFLKLVLHDQNNSEMPVIFFSRSRKPTTTKMHCSAPSQYALLPLGNYSELLFAGQYNV